ncbi:hypothetical protein ABZU75_13240 [Streptosporangium sp. NPDC005286]|uniref:hypothetical protein n=1 Tax=Streptosporangium sp. NPDC005286 TaxID=3154463 RepID=UPI0033A872A0
MKRIRNLAAAAVAMTALVLAPLPASAAGTTIHRDTDTGLPYSGKIRATLIDPVSVSTTLATATCNTGNIDGTVQSDGTALNVSVFNFSNTPGPACPNSAGGSSTVSPVGLAWNGGTVVYNKVTPGRDGIVTLLGVKVSSVSTGWFGTISCVYRGSGAGNSIALDAFNPDNASRPKTAIAQAQAKATSYALTKDSGSILCPGTASYTATFQLMGETVANSGVFDQKLYLTTP